MFEIADQDSLASWVSRSQKKSTTQIPPSTPENKIPQTEAIPLYMIACVENTKEFTRIKTTPSFNELIYELMKISYASVNDQRIFGT